MRISLIFIIAVTSAIGCAPASLQAQSITPYAPVTTTPLREQPPARVIYVLAPNDLSVQSSIILIDPDSQRVIRTIATRTLPEMALSADGRLYVADSYYTQVTRGERRDVISVYDALSGVLLIDDVSIPDRLLYKGLPSGEPFFFLSDDEHHLYAMQYGDPDVHQLRLTIFDANTLQVLQEVSWPPCGQRLAVQSDRWLCANRSTSAISIDVVDPLEGRIIEPRLNVPTIHGEAILAAGPTRLYVLVASNELAVVDLEQYAIIKRQNLDADRDWHVVWDSIQVAPDGRYIYVGFDTGDDASQYFTDAIVIYDTTSWECIGTIQLRDNLTHFALSAEGDQLYAVSPWGRNLSIWDTKTFEEVAVLSELGGSPARIMVSAER